MKTFVVSFVVALAAFRMWRASRERRDGGAK